MQPVREGCCPRARPRSCVWWHQKAPCGRRFAPAARGVALPTWGVGLFGLPRGHTQRHTRSLHDVWPKAPRPGYIYREALSRLCRPRSVDTAAAAAGAIFSKHPQQHPLSPPRQARVKAPPLPPSIFFKSSAPAPGSQSATISSKSFFCPYNLGQAAPPTRHIAGVSWTRINTHPNLFPHTQL